MNVRGHGRPISSRLSITSHHILSNRHIIRGDVHNLSIEDTMESVREALPSLMSKVNAPVVVAATGALVGAAALADPYLGISNDARLLRGEIEFLLASKRHMFWNHTMADVWEETASRLPSKVAVIAASIDAPNSAHTPSYTFREADIHANRVANLLTSQGISSGKTLGLLMTNRAEFVFSSVGAAKAGATVAMLNYNLPPHQLAHCITICDAAAVMYESSYHDAIVAALKEVRGRSIKLLRWDVNEALPAPVPRSTDGASGKGGASGHASIAAASGASAGGADAATPSSSTGSVPVPVLEVVPALSGVSTKRPPRSLRSALNMLTPWGYVFTSGTTGLPKAAVIAHLRFFMAGHLMSGVTGITGEDRILTVLPLYHSAGGMIGLGACYTRGCTVVILNKFSTRRYWDVVAAHKPTVVQYIGELCRWLTSAPPHPLEAKHTIRIAIGNGMRPDVWPVFQKRFAIPTVAEFYASTEGNASMVCVCSRPEDQGAVGRFGTIIRSIGLFRIAKHDDDTGELVRGADGFCVECKPNEPGELLGYLKLDDKTGLRTFKGYHGDSKATEKKIARNVFKAGDAYFRTGDLLKVSPTGHYYFVDRTGDTFRFKGENVATTEVAEVLSGFEGIQEVNVYGAAVPGVEGRAGMAAFVPKLPHSDGHKGEEEEQAGTAASTASSSAAEPVGYLPPTFDLKAFAAHCKSSLPSYAVPVFLRVLPEVPVTSTFKHLKKELREEGADPSKVRDPLYWLNSDTGSYEPLTADTWLRIVGGHARL